MRALSLHPSAMLCADSLTDWLCSHSRLEGQEGCYCHHPPPQGSHQPHPGSPNDNLHRRQRQQPRCQWHLRRLPGNCAPLSARTEHQLTARQDIVKALFGDAETNKSLKLGAVNSINFSRILAQIVYYFYSYFQLVKKSDSFKLGDKVRFVVPTGNFVRNYPVSLPAPGFHLTTTAGRYSGRIPCAPYGFAS